MKYDCELTLKLNEELMKKLLIVSESEGRTPNNQFLFMLRNNIAYYEKTKGRIKPDQLAKIDVSEYKSQSDT